MSELVSIKKALIVFLETMADDLKRRSFDEQGDQKEETLGRMNELKELLRELRGDQD